MDIQTYCHYLFHSLFIPIYVYENKSLVASYPDQPTTTLPPKSYADHLWASNQTVSCTITSVYSFYGCVQVANSTTCIIIGPVNNLAYTKESLAIMNKEYSVQQVEQEAFATFFHYIPTMNPLAFINTLLFVNFTINNTTLTKNDVAGWLGHEDDPSINRNYAEHAFVSKEKEDGFTLRSYETGNEIIRYIETGNTAALRKMIHPETVVIGSLAKDKLRHMKNLFISTNSLAVNAAIRGGLSPSIAYQLSETYINQVERLTDPNAIASLIEQSLTDYTNRVAASDIPSDTDVLLRQAIHFIRANTNRPLTVSDVAEQVGYSRTYLSSKFKKGVGMDLSDYIQKCKLEEAKDLLLYSDKSISDISSYLGFSSQSHLQKVFKKQFGVTPHVFRNSM